MNPNLFRDWRYQEEYFNQEEKPTNNNDGDFYNRMSREKWIPEQMEKINNNNKVEEEYNYVTADHYKDVFKGHQFVQVALGLTKHLPREEAVIMSHVYKYCFRIGKKDNDMQDAQKAEMWLKILQEYYNSNLEDMPEELR